MVSMSLFIVLNRADRYDMKTTLSCVSKSYILDMVISMNDFKALCVGPAVLNSNDPTEETPDSDLLDKVEVREPFFYKVILFNDDFTPMDFVTHVLQRIYNKSSEEAQRIMLDVHQSGQAVAGVFSFEIAETKVFLTNNLSKQNKYPLKCSMEQD